MLQKNNLQQNNSALQNNICEKVLHLPVKIPRNWSKVHYEVPHDSDLMKINFGLYSSSNYDTKELFLRRQFTSRTILYYYTVNIGSEYGGELVSPLQY